MDFDPDDFDAEPDHAPYIRAFFIENYRNDERFEDKCLSDLTDEEREEVEEAYWESLEEDDSWNDARR